MDKDTLSSSILIKKDEDRKRTFKDRKRTNILKSTEQSAIGWLVSRMPAFVSPNMLTGLGMFGSLLVLVGFLLAAHLHVSYLLIGVTGLAINWLGDSLDGRIAYYRNIPRKWYGFSLDIIMDWISTILMGLGFLVYIKGDFEIVAFLFVAFYGWAMIISQLRYKITDKYTIDSGIFGPTEVRLIICGLLITEIFFAGSIDWLAMIMCFALFIINLIDTQDLLALGNQRDLEEKAANKGNK
ncbi:CDP-alcohol phosphatidyltransferase family protein [Arcticibacter eurypsychrophilus]|uniref:CDP-alcohol phosphatidyltransferase family protein n=1 Tax=Arcticibacter eurypsychrophilus TaxID=1434752 RepID=UPI000B1E93EA|nr:CDP-alcohol phosphatidyltransferase family protein [Arcticibacter eurypsychrophilus]